MGNSVAAVTKKMKQQQEESQKEMENELRTLSAILDAKEAAFKAQLIQVNTANKELPIDKIVKLVTRKVCDVSIAPSDKMVAMIDSLFGGSFLSAAKGLVLGALDTVLGNASAGSKEDKGFTVLLLHGAVVRVDYYVYSYTLRSDGVVTKLQNGLVFAVSMATVRLANVNSEVVALLSGLTAEGSIGYMARYNSKLKAVGIKAKRPPPFNYTEDEATSLITTLFGSDSTKELQDDPEANKGITAGERLKKIREDFAGADADAQADRTQKVNDLLCGLTAVYDIPKSELDSVFEEQKKILEKMSQIYDKIAQMKRETQASIAYAENRMASNPRSGTPQ